MDWQTLVLYVGLTRGIIWAYSWRIMKWHEDGTELAKRRREAGLTQAALAKRTGKSRSLIRDVELGKIRLKGELARQLWEAVAEARFERDKQVVSLSSLRRGLISPPVNPESGPKQIKGHYFNVKECKTGGYNMEFQGPGMPVCEEYHFATGAELLAFVAKTIDVLPKGETMVLKSDMMSKQPVEE